jgi:hypothetical protein
MSALYAVQAAVYSRLKSDSTLQALLAPSILDGTSGVFNDVPDQQSYPFIDIGEDSMERPWNSLGGATTGIGFDDRIVVHIWSRYQGNTEGSLILKEVMRLLNFYDLSVTGYTSVICNFDNVRCLKEQVDKIETRHFPAMFRVRVQQ